MEWLLLLACAAVAAALIGLPHAGRDGAAAEDEDALERERRRLLEELRELDDDAASGRISAEERLAGRRALAPRLRSVTESLRAAGIDARAGG